MTLGRTPDWQNRLISVLDANRAGFLSGTRDQPFGGFRTPMCNRPQAGAPGQRLYESVHRSWTGRRSMRNCLYIGFGLAVLVFAQAAWAITFQCVDPFGHRVFTDSPSQLHACTVVHPETPPAPPPPALPPSADGAPSTSSPESQAGSPQPMDTVTVPLVRAGRSLVVQARLNDTRDAHFIVDTGADITVLSHEVVRDLGLVPTASAPTITLNTVGGTVRADMIRLDTINVGEAEVHNVMVAVHDLPEPPTGVDGLLGLSFLDHFLVTLDAKQGKLHLGRQK